MTSNASSDRSHGRVPRSVLLNLLKPNPFRVSSVATKTEACMFSKRAVRILLESCLVFWLAKLCSCDGLLHHRTRRKGSVIFFR